MTKKIYAVKITSEGLKIYSEEVVAETEKYWGVIKDDIIISYAKERYIYGRSPEEAIQLKIQEQEECLSYYRELTEKVISLLMELREHPERIIDDKD